MIAEAGVPGTGWLRESASRDDSHSGRHANLLTVAMPGDSSSARVTPDPEEAALLQRLRAGDEAAFEVLVRTYGGRLMTAAHRILGSEEDARDAVQEAFLSAFRSLGGFEGHSRLSTWIHQIAINASLMKLRT